MKPWRIAAMVAIGFGAVLAIFTIPFIIGMSVHGVWAAFLSGWGMVK